jgi:hypothetical protein
LRMHRCVHSTIAIIAAQGVRRRLVIVIAVPCSGA